MWTPFLVRTGITKLMLFIWYGILKQMYQKQWYFLKYFFQGILGSVHSGKSALVHRYLTGSYMQEESPEGELWNAGVENPRL